jgi:hypothetical protein
MMKYLIGILVVLLSQSSCSVIPLGRTESLITLQDVEQIKLGLDSRAILENKFGKPSREFSISSDEYVIFYNRPYYKDGTISAQRASFVISKKLDRVLTAQWNPNSENELKDVNEVKRYFRAAKFSFEKHPLSGGHEGPLGYTLSDRASGVSLEVSEQDQKVESIGFSLPAERAVGSVKQ